MLLFINFNYNCESCVLVILRVFMCIRNDVYDYAEVKVKQVDELQNKEAITPRVQLHQNVLLCHCH